jgi:hypothetical protein
MLHHVSFNARNPETVASALAEMIDATTNQVKYILISSNLAASSVLL